MSLAYYEPTKYEHKTEEKRPSPNYEEQEELMQIPTLAQRERIFCNLIWTTDVLCFMSPDEATKYESFKKANKRDTNFKQIINLQQLGIGLPLMEAQFKLFRGLGDSKFATIFKCVPPPPGSNRKFKQKKDKFEFCTVRKKHEWHRNTRYAFTILPNQNNPSDTFKFSMFVHRRLPIIDVTPIGGSHIRYRWIRTSPGFLSEDFTYTLYALDEKQKSMVDNMDVANQKLDKTNSILNTTSNELMTPGGKTDPKYLAIKEDISLLKFLNCGIDPLYVSKDTIGELNRLDEIITISTFQKDNKQPHVTQPQDESIDSVGVDELVLLCMSFVLNRIEEVRIQRMHS